MQSNSSGIYPFDVKVLVKPDPVEEKTAGGIIRPDTMRDKQQFAATKGRLIAVGPNAFKDWGSNAAPKLGDAVLYAQYAGKTHKGSDGAEYTIMNDEDLIACVTGGA